VGSRDSVSDRVYQLVIHLARQMIHGLSLIEARHFDRVFDRYTVSVDTRLSVAALRNRDDATIDLGRE
jgi:hypothetical protein